MGAGRKARGVIRRDRKVIFTTTRQPYPFVVDRGGGDYAYDIDGKRFIDFATFISAYNLGVNTNREVRTAIKSQVDKLMHAAFLDYYSELPVRFAESLLGMMPSGFGRVFFSNSGTEANEAALKLSRIFTGRQYTLSFYNGFHGRSMGSLGLTALESSNRKSFGPFNSALHAPYAYCYRCPWGKEYPGCGIACADYVKKYTLSKEVGAEEVGAIFMEPVLGSGGAVVPPKEFVVEMRKLSEDNGMLLVSDEVQVGYMRTGKFLALDNFGVEADIYTMAKSVGAGLPLGVTLAKRSFGDIPEGAMGGTFGGNLAAVAGANASLSYLKKHRGHIESGIRSKNRLIMKRLERMKDLYEVIGDVRGIGMIMGIEFVKDRKSKEPAGKERDAVLMECFNGGLLVLPGGASSIRMMPPLTISEPNLEKGLDIFEEAIRKVDGRRGT